jgi:transposase
VRVLHRLEQVGESLRAALHVLATVTPEWPEELASAGWFDRYGSRVENYALPKTEAARRELARVIGADGQRLLHAIDAAPDHP